MILLQHLSASQCVVKETYQRFGNLAGKWVCSVTSLLMEKVHTEGSMQPVMSHILQTAALYRRHLLKCTQHWLLYVYTQIHSLTCSWLHTVSHLLGWGSIFWRNIMQSPTLVCQSNYANIVNVFCRVKPAGVVCRPALTGRNHFFWVLLQAVIT